MKRLRFVLAFILVLGITVLYQNCSNIRLEQYKVAAYKASKVGLDICTTRPDTVKSNLKFIFVMDRSGSNQIQYDTDPQSSTFGQVLPGNDATGIRRFAPVVDFLDNFNDSDPAYTYFSWINFATNSDVINWRINNVDENFTSDKQTFRNRVQQEGRGPNYGDLINPQDGGFSNYQVSLQDARTIIEQDIADAEDDFLNGVTGDDTDNDGVIDVPRKVASNYVIFFIAGGEPLDGQDINGDGILDVQPLGDLQNEIRQINSLQDSKRDYVDGITLNTAYYYSNPFSPIARTYLQQMADDGNGTYLEFSGGQEIDFTRFAIPSRIARFTLRELWISDANTVWQGDYLAPDSDADGISDWDEIALGSNPNAYDSDGNGLGDGVEVKLYAKPCLNATCAAPGTGTSQCSTFRDPLGAAGMVDTDLDDLNDCEEVLLKSDRRDPDTNSDFIPDGVALRAGIQVIEPSSASTVDPDVDNLSDYNEVKYNSPIGINNSQVPNLRLTQYTSRMTSSDATQDCYHFDVHNLVFQGSTDRMRVYIIEDTKVLSSRKVIRRAEVPAAFGYLYLTDQDFQKYQP